ncbi:MAG: thermonuclease family protein [Candidatus Caldarchaeales archaeon]
MKSSRYLLVIVFLIISLSLAITNSDNPSFEIDVTATVYKVIDGDTFDAFPVGRVRMADINAPELDETGGIEAKNTLADLILGRRVYLDVDDREVVDRYNRLICVVYVRHDPQRLLNVNKWLVEENLVEIVDHDNEFDPSAWNLYEEYGEHLELSAKTITVTKTVSIFSSETLVKEVTILSTTTVSHTYTILKTLTTTIARPELESINMMIIGVLVVLIAFMVVLLLRRKR